MLNMRIFADIFSARMHVYMIRTQDIGIREQEYGAQGYSRRDCAARCPFDILPITNNDMRPNIRRLLAEDCKTKELRG